MNYWFNEKSCLNSLCIRAEPNCKPAFIFKDDFTYYVISVIYKKCTESLRVMNSFHI